MYPEYIKILKNQKEKGRYLAEIKERMNMHSTKKKYIESQINVWNKYKKNIEINEYQVTAS